jgi:hypothetical protein
MLCWDRLNWVRLVDLEVREFRIRYIIRGYVFNG